MPGPAGAVRAAANTHDVAVNYANVSRVSRVARVACHVPPEALVSLMSTIAMCAVCNHRPTIVVCVRAQVRLNDEVLFD